MFSPLSTSPKVTSTLSLTANLPSFHPKFVVASFPMSNSSQSWDEYDFSSENWEEHVPDECNLMCSFSLSNSMYKVWSSSSLLGPAFHVRERRLPRALLALRWVPGLRRWERRGELPPRVGQSDVHSPYDNHQI